MTDSSGFWSLESDRPEKVFRCEAGHELRIRAHQYISLQTNYGSERRHNFCLVCWGEWAEKQWPLTEAT